MSEYFEQAKVHCDRGELDQAIQALGNHLNTNFHHAEALFMLGGCFIQKGFNGIGAALTQQALKIRPRFPEALLNLGVCFKHENKTTEAAEIWRMALEVEDVPGERAKIWNNLGSLYVNEGCPEKAVECFGEALKINPHQPDAHFNRGLAYLEQGRWREGWAGYERGWETGDRKKRTYKNLPVWDGTPGQTVIVWGEQGVGDEILFASCLPDMIRVSKKVVFDCHPRLVELFKRSFPEVEIHGTRKQLNNLDWVDACAAEAHLCISSLPSHFRNRDSEFPGTPFLKAGDTRSAERAAGADFRQTGPRIGISWAGGTKKTRGDLRSIPLEQWQPVLTALAGPHWSKETTGNATFYSLQYTPQAAAEVCELEEKTGLRVKHYPGWVACKDYDRTASFVASLDLVITVATAVHHLSNALGVPTWTLAAAQPSWRYTKAAEQFYRNCGGRFFHQREAGDWSGVIGEVTAALKERFA